MPFIRYTRDKRGYEHTYVMHAYRPSSGPQKSRVLYLFRSPSHIRVGRQALDDEAREALEHTHPDLSFDWTAVPREPAPRPAMRERPTRSSARAGGGARQAPAAAPRPAPAIDDQTVLGRALGASEAARLRARHADLVQRVLRRARTPEDRDRLIERAERLNPDEWPDETAARAGATTVEAEFDAIAAELPQRRRGRRGGRRRPPVEAAGATGEAGSVEAGAADGPPGPSGIIESGAEEIEPDAEDRDGQENSTEDRNDEEGVRRARPDGEQQIVADRTRDAGGDGDRLGPGAGAVAPGRTGDDFPGDG